MEALIVVIFLVLMIGFLVKVLGRGRDPRSQFVSQAEPSEEQSRTISANIGKTCPRCAETVKAAAKACRYCGYTLEKSEKDESAGGFSGLVTVTLADTGPLKINVIKEVRALFGIGLREAKDLVESTPVVIARQISVMEAERMQRILQKAQATVTIRSS